MTAPLVGLLLAAGRGARFDASGQRNKLLAQVNGEPVALVSARNLAAVVDHLLIVVRPQSEALRALLCQALDARRVTVLECPDAGSGMGHSLAFGVAQAVARFGPRALLVGLADMPFVSGRTLAALAALSADSLGTAADATADAVPESARIIAAPRLNGQRGHPVLFGAAHFAALAQCRGDNGAAALLRSEPVHWIDVDDPGVLRDIDRPEDLE